MPHDPAALASLTQGLGLNPLHAAQLPQLPHLTGLGLPTPSNPHGLLSHAQMPAHSLANTPTVANTTMHAGALLPPNTHALTAAAAAAAGVGNGNGFPFAATNNGLGAGECLES